MEGTHGTARVCQRVRPLPELVVAAKAAAAELGFAHSCSDSTGWLLRTLAAVLPPGSRVGESGTGCGVGTAWLLSAAVDLELITVEREPDRVAAARAALRAVSGSSVLVLGADWSELSAHGPFDLLFCDGGGKTTDPDAVVGLLAPGGLVIFDDFAPSDDWPPRYRGAVDVLRLTYLQHPLLTATEIGVSSTETVVLGVRRRQ